MAVPRSFLEPLHASASETRLRLLLAVSRALQSPGLVSILVSHLAS